MSADAMNKFVEYIKSSPGWRIQVFDRMPQTGKASYGLLAWKQVYHDEYNTLPEHDKYGVESFMVEIDYEDLSFLPIDIQERIRTINGMRNLAFALSALVPK